MIRWPKTELPDSDHAVAEVGPCKRKRDYRKRPWAEIGRETYFFTYIASYDSFEVSDILILIRCSLQCWSEAEVPPQAGFEVEAQPKSRFQRDSMFIFFCKIQGPLILLCSDNK